jgi:hypothetical protein
MPARKLDRSMSLAELRREIVWSQGACEDEPSARPHAVRFGQLLEEWQPLYFKTLSLDDAVLRAVQSITRIDNRCDGHVDDFNVALLAVVNQNRRAPHYALYFKDIPSRIKRPVLGDELATLRDWLPLLERETDPRLQPFHALFSQDVADANAALAARTAAEEALRHSRATGEIARFFDRVELVRDDVYGQLDQYRVQHPELDLPRDYASQFFLKTPPRELNEEQRQARAQAKAQERAEKAAREEKRRAAKEKLRAARRELAELRR